jgi:hypothetical protein
MAFTNLWDNTFPPDTQLANLIGANLRQLRVDTQQRMAAISGLDASRPAFSGDTQPTGWNGILFFATDTGKIYQFQSPNWNDITSSFIGGGGRIFALTGGSNVSVGTWWSPILGTLEWTTLETDAQSVLMPVALTITTIAYYFFQNIASGTCTLNLFKNGVSAISIPVSAGFGPGFASQTVEIAFAAGDLAVWQFINASGGEIEVPAISIVY